VPWRQPGDWALNYPIASTTLSLPDPDDLVGNLYIQHHDTSANPSAILGMKKACQ
jgi:hypothetical protein